MSEPQQLEGVKVKEMAACLLQLVREGQSDAVLVVFLAEAHLAEDRWLRRAFVKPARALEWLREAVGKPTAPCEHQDDLVLGELARHGHCDLWTDDDAELLSITRFMLYL